MKEIIEIEQMEFYAYHGCYEAERIVGNRFWVDLTVVCDATKAAESDFVGDTISYLDLFEMVKVEMDIPSNILEHVAKRILGSIKGKYPQTEKVSVKISKLNPPLGGQIEKVSVRMEA